MGKKLIWLFPLIFAATARAADRWFDFSAMPLNQAPTGCVSIVNGDGKPGEWKVIEDEVPFTMRPLTPGAVSSARRAVVAQLSRDFTDEHFPILLLGDEVYGDFKLTARFKIMTGAVEQMAGLAFRLQDNKDYYVLRASALGNNFRFYKVVNGLRSLPIGPELPITIGVWHEIDVDCEGNQIRCRFDGQEPIPPITDNSLGVGKIGLLTKSDSVSYFTDIHIVYTPREPLIQSLVRDAVSRYPHVLGLAVCMMSGRPAALRVVASTESKDLGTPGGKDDADVIARSTVYYQKLDQAVVVTLPLCDRNGDSVASVRVRMKTFKGQTEENAIARALPVVKRMQQRATTAADLIE